MFVVVILFNHFTWLRLLSAHFSLFLSLSDYFPLFLCVESESFAEEMQVYDKENKPAFHNQCNKMLINCLKQINIQSHSTFSSYFHLHQLFLSITPLPPSASLGPFHFAPISTFAPPSVALVVGVIRCLDFVKGARPVNFPHLASKMYCSESSFCLKMLWTSSHTSPSLPLCLSLHPPPHGWQFLLSPG